MILDKKNTLTNDVLLPSVFFGFFPASFILGNLATNINLVLFCGLSIYFLKSKILTIKISKPLKIIFLFFFIVFFTTTLSLVRSIYFQEYEQSDLDRLIKSLAYFRFFLLILIVYFLSRLDMIDFKYFLIISTLATIILSVDLIYQYAFGFDLMGSKSLGHYNSGFFGDELIAGSYIKNFGFFSLLFIIYYFKDKNSLRFILFLLATCILGAGIILSGNRMPLILFLFGLLLLFLFDIKFKKILFVSLISLIIVFSYIFSIDNIIKGKFITYYINAENLVVSIFDKEKVNELEKKTDTEKSKSHNFLKKKTEKQKEQTKNKDDNTLDVIKYAWEEFVNPPKWNKGQDITDDFEFFWVLQNERDSHNKIYLTALDVWSKNKLFGNGIKSFRIDCQKLLVHKRNRLCSNHPHNYYLEILTDTGILGIFVIILMGFLFIYFIFKYFRLLNDISIHNLILLGSTISLFLEAFPIKSSGSIFTTSNATYIAIIVSIILACKNTSLKKL